MSGGRAAAARRRVARLGVAALAAALAAALGCSASPTEAAGPDGVRAAADRDEVRVTNGRTRPVFTFVVGRAYAARILWGPCADAAVCPPIAPGATLRLPRAQVGAEPDEREALVYWWHTGARVDGVVRPDSIRAVVVPLP